MSECTDRSLPSVLPAGPSRFRLRTRAVMVAVSLGLTATVVASPLGKSHGDTAKPVAHRHWLQIGKASWYGLGFQGKKTATGEKFDMNALTCAHRTLPLGSWIRVTNLHNSKTAFLRVNDRGPMSTGLIVDLSYAAARRLGVDGLAKVRIEEITPAEPTLVADLVSQLPAPTNPAVYTR